MYRKLMQLGLLGALALLLFNHQQVQAMNVWVFGDSRYFTFNHLCRDGAEIASGYWNSTGADTNEGEGSLNDVGARLLTTDGITPPVGAGELPENYGPLLAETHYFDLEYHPGDPLMADLDGNGSQEYSFYVYSVDDLLWSRHLDVGETVVLTHFGLGYLSGPVEDCFLNPTSVQEGDSVTIGADKLDVGFGLLGGVEIVYEITALPANGDLYLDGVLLQVGDHFTQSDVDNGRFSYSHDDSDTLSDSFGYIVRGTKRVSVSDDGSEGQGISYFPAISADGTKVVFQSTAENLVTSDSNGFLDVFMHDLADGTTTIQSVATNGAQGNNSSFAANISADGTAVGFISYATNFTSSETPCNTADTNGVPDAFMRTFGSTRRVSVSTESFSSCDEANSPSANIALSESTAVFQSAATNLDSAATNGESHIFDRFNTFTDLTSKDGGVQGNDSSFAPDITPDSTAITYYSDATNLVTGDTNGVADVFVTTASDTVRVSLTWAGSEADDGDSQYPSISDSGRYVAFSSDAINLLFCIVNCPLDSNDARDIFVRDRDGDEDDIFDEADDWTFRVSIATDGTEANAASYRPVITGNGRYIIFTSYATNLVSGDTNNVSDAFVRDLQTGETVRVSIAADGTEMNDFISSWRTGISDDGDFVVFDSAADNLVPGDTNNAIDVFVHYRGYSGTFNITVTEKHELYLPIILK